MLDNDVDDPEQDEKNIYGIENLEVLQDEPDAGGDDEFLEVIDESLTTGDARNESSDVDDSAGFSGDGDIFENVTPSASTVRMITTQLQRLTQLVQHVQDKNNGVIDDDEVTAEDLNSFLATQKVQSNSPDYQQTDFHSDEKTPMPSNGRIHPEILTDILDQQNQLNQLTTISMDQTTPKSSRRKQTYYMDDSPITEIKMKSGQGADGTASHQIVVNRPEGSVMFNVPQAADQNHQSPYLSEDILKTILEISKQMVTQNHQKQSPQVSYAPQPFYYAVPVPYLSPQNGAQNYYSHEYRNNLTDANKPMKSQSAAVHVIQAQPTAQLQSNTKLSNKVDANLQGYVDSFGYYHAPKPQQNYANPNPQQSFQNPNYYYQNYPQYGNGYQQSYQQQQYPQSYKNQQQQQQQYPQSYKNHFNDPQNYNQFNYDGAYYGNNGNRPFVIESSAPSYVGQSKPFRKESYAESFEGDEEDKIDENLYDEVDEGEDETPPEKNPLICTPVVQRQANQTDCYRYYVCNAKTKEVLSYMCPIFTAFNDQTKFCDSHTYKACKKVKDRESSDKHNQIIYDEAHKALEQVKKESQKVERIASMVRKESQKIYKRRNQYEAANQYQSGNYHPSAQYDIEDQYQSNQYEQQHQAPAYRPSNFAQIQKVQKPVVSRPQVIASRPQSISSAPVYNPRPKPPRKASKKKKKKVKCRDVGNIVDPESSTSYWHCFRGTDQRMKRINRKCTTGFVFCPSTRYCSTPDRCRD